MAEVATATLEQAAVLDQLGAAIALQALARRTDPGVGDKALALHSQLGRFQRFDDAPLQAKQVVANGLGVHAFVSIRSQRLIAR